MKEFKEKTAPKMLGILQNHMKDGHFNGSGGVCIMYMFLTVEMLILIFQKLSWVDIQAFSTLDTFTSMQIIKLEDYPEMKKLYDIVSSEPRIKKWLETRPQTPF